MLDKSNYKAICSIRSESFLKYMVGLNSSLFRTQRSSTFLSEIIQCKVDLTNNLFL